MKDIILTPKLAKAARALLDWQQSDLAEAAGVSLSAVKLYENGGEKTRKGTISALQAALEENGIEFPPSGGLRAVEDVTSVVRYTGPDFISRWNEDIFAACTNPNEEILTSSTDEKWWYHPSVREANKAFLQWMETRKIVIHSLIPEGHNVFNLPKKAYRTLPASMLGKITYCLYGDRIAFVIWKKRQIVILRNRSVVETFRAQFTHLWRLGRSLGRAG